MKIIPAKKEHAAEIGAAVVMAITPELVLESFNHHGVDHSVEEYVELFSRLAAREDSQYSYLNALVALDEDKVIGVIVGYDGAKLAMLRQAFIDMAAQDYGIVFDKPFADETEPGEFYLDTLAVKPEARGRGIGRALLSAMVDRAHKEAGKPAGLLVDKKNDRARRLYEAVGFIPVGDRLFIGELMTHMQHPKSDM
ncbi:MAG: GNAT family N-acetyltransferase [Bacteroidales bacterium]|nr:GNAT family N-acetyltransferase [Bacteroidales bacterium]